VFAYGYLPSANFLPEMPVPPEGRGVLPPLEVLLLVFCGST